MCLSLRYVNNWKRVQSTYKFFGYVPMDDIFHQYNLSFIDLEAFHLFKYNKQKAMETTTMFGYDLTKEGKQFFKESFFYRELFLLKPWKKYAFKKYVENKSNAKGYNQ